MDQEKGFTASLFDLSFKALITSRLVTVLYGLSVTCAGITAVLMIKSAFSFSAITGFATLIGAPLLFLIIVIWARVILEIIMVLFRISNDVAKMAASIDLNKDLESQK